MKFLRLFLLVSFVVGSAHAFSVPDHRKITELAFEELQQCKLIPNSINVSNDGGYAASQIIINANLEEDNYLVNGFKKLFVYSHFYNPLRPLKVGILGRNHADHAVQDYTQDLMGRYQGADKVRASNEVLQDIGKMTHLIQDVSSAPHVLWINHGPEDGFENKVDISKDELRALKPGCGDISLAGLKSPMQIMKAGGLASMKELEDLVEYEEILPDGSVRTNLFAWSRTFFSNPDAYTQKVHLFLRDFNLLKPNLNSPITDDKGASGWNIKPLSQGAYGPFSNDIINVLIRGDNFGNTNIIEFAGRKVRVQEEQYKKFKKVLMRQAVLNTQRTILWLNSL